MLPKRFELMKNLLRHRHDKEQMTHSRSILRPLLGVATVATLSLMAFNAAIRYWLRAPRVSIKDDPSAFGLPFRDVLLPTANNKQIHGWYIPADSGQPSPTLIILHGWGGNREMMLPLADPFYHSGYALLFVDARSHGASEGDSFSSLPHFAEDLEGALNWLLLQPETDTARIGLIGHSVGAAAALLVASRRKEVAVVVSLASFAHPERIMRRYLASKSVPFIPFGWYTLSYIQYVIGFSFEDIAPQNTIGNIDCPVMLAHGKDDTTVPVEDAELLHAKSRKGRSHLLLVEGNHEDYEGLRQRADEVLGFVARAMEKAQSGNQSGTAIPSSNCLSSPL